MAVRTYISYFELAESQASYLLSYTRNLGLPKFLRVSGKPIQFSLTMSATFVQVVIEIPYILVQTIIYGVIVYAMIGFDWTAAKFFWYLFFMYFALLFFTFYGMTAVAVTPNLKIAAIVSISFYFIWNLFSGFTIPKMVSSIFAHTFSYRMTS